MFECLVTLHVLIMLYFTYILWTKAGVELAGPILLEGRHCFRWFFRIRRFLLMLFCCRMLLFLGVGQFCNLRCYKFACKEKNFLLKFFPELEKFLFLSGQIKNSVRKTPGMEPEIIQSETGISGLFTNQRSSFEPVRTFENNLNLHFNR